MGMLSDLQRQVHAASTGQPVPPPQDSIGAVVDAIKSLDLVVSHPESTDYSQAIESLTKAVTGALKANSSALIKALDQINITVEAPTVNVAAPSVEVKPEFEVNLPESSPQPFSIDFERKKDGGLIAHITDYQPTKPAERVTME